LIPSARAQSAAKVEHAPMLAITGILALEALATMSHPHRPLSNNIWASCSAMSSDLPITLSTALCRPISSAKQEINPLDDNNPALCIPPVLLKPACWDFINCNPGCSIESQKLILEFMIGKVLIKSSNPSVLHAPQEVDVMPEDLDSIANEASPRK